MNFIKSFTAIFLLFVLTLTAADNFKKVKIFPNSKSDYKVLSEISADHFWKDKDGGLIIFISEKEYQTILKNGIKNEVLIDDWISHYEEQSIETNPEQLRKQLNKTSEVFGVKSFDFGSMGGYYTLIEVYEKLDEMYSSYPNLITAKESIGQSVQSRDIYFVKISDNPEVDESEPEVLYTSLHHAREPEGMMQMIYFMFYLLENYGSDPEVTYLVNNREMYFIPVVNPDGYEENRRLRPSGGGMHRKNMRSNSDGTKGVDLNRNYGPMEYWNSPNGGSSLNPGSDTYRGTAPFSEPETQTIRNFLMNHEIRACLNYHTFSNLLIYPYGALGRETADSTIFREFAADMTQFNNYVYGTDEQTVGYTTRGNSDDYFYDGEIELKGKIFAMTPEVGSGSDGFWPSQNRIIPLAEENIFPNLYYAWIVGGYVSPTNVTTSAEYINPGDIVELSVGIKNKGLDEFNNFSIQFSSGSDNIQLISDKITLNGLQVREEITLQNAFQIKISESAKAGDNFDVLITTIKDDIAMFTKTATFRIGSPKPVFVSYSDDFIEQWKTKSNNSTNWSLTDKDFYSESTSITDSKNGTYKSDANLSFEMIESVQLPDSGNVFLEFQTKFEIENGWDYGQVLISTDHGTSWKALRGKLSTTGSGQFQPIGQPVYSGRVMEWSNEEIDLSEYLDKGILVKFQLLTDGAVEMDGWYIDDIQINSFGSSITSADGSNQLPSEFVLSDNYPNPFNPSTTIEYSIPEIRQLTNELSEINVKLAVYDILGREVAILINEYQKPGNYSVAWNTSSVKAFDGKELGSGIYFYRITAGNYVKSKKMLLLK